MASKKTLEKAGTKRAKNASQASNVSESRKTKTIGIRMTVQESYYTYVDVPVDVTEEEIETIVYQILEEGPYQSEEDSVLIDHEIEDPPEDHTGEGDCSAVRTNGRIRVIY